MSSLPKIDYPVLKIQIPSLKKDFMFRPFLVKEEKLLFMAKESKKEADIFIAIKQVIQNCCLEKNFDVDKIAIFDLEYIFIKLRSFSIENTVKLSLRDADDKNMYEFEVNLDEVEIVYPKQAENTIKINENVGLIMKFPPASIYSDESFLSLQKDQLFELILRCIDKIYDGEEVIDVKTVKKEDLTEFIESMNIKVFEKVHEFLINTPKIKYEIKYKNSLGNEKVIELNSLNDFFSWR